MITFPQIFEEPSSSDLSDLESLPTPKSLIIAPPTQGSPSLRDESRACARSVVTRRKGPRTRSQRRRSKSTNLRQRNDESSSDEDGPVATHPVLIRAEQKLKKINRYTQRKTSHPKSYQELSSSDLSEPGSPLTEQEPSSEDEPSDSESEPKFSESGAVSPMQDTPSPADKTPSSTSHNQASSARNEEWILEHPKQSPHRFQVKTIQEQSTKSASSSFIDAPCDVSHRSANHGQVQVTQRKSPPSQQPEIMEMLVTPSQRENSPPVDTLDLLSSSHGDFNQQNFFVPQALNYVQDQFYMPHQSGLSQQIPNQQNQFDIPENGEPTLEQNLWNQQKPAISDFSNIDPILSGFGSKGTGTFNQYSSLPAHPILLDIGKPIQIPIWEIRNFRPLCSCGDEPSELALSDYEGDTDVSNSLPNAPGSRPVKEVNGPKQAHRVRGPAERKRERFLRRRDGLSNRSRKPSRAHGTFQAQDAATRGTRRISGPEARDEQKRFILLLHSYWGMDFADITLALNREFETGDHDEPWSTKRTKKCFAAARCEPGLEEYRNVLIKARVGNHEPEGLSEDVLREAKGFLQRLGRD